MSVIGVKGVPAKWSLLDVVKAVAKSVAGPFEPLNFTPGKYPNAHLKICYLRISETLDPMSVVERITSSLANRGLNAFIPDHVPDLPISQKSKIPLRLRNKLNIPEFQMPHDVITKTHFEVFTELQYKYPGLYNLSRKTGHKLLDELAAKIGERLKQIMETNPEVRDSSFKLSKSYRKTHPHFGDFQLILSTLHNLQDAAGAPRAQINEAELAASTTQPYVVNNVPLEKVKAACNKYNDRINNVITAHVMALDSKPSPNDTEEEIARKKIREELKKILPHLPTALKQIVSSHFIPEEQPYRRVRIYGEPFLPSREALKPFILRYNRVGSWVMRSSRMYNLLRFKADHTQYCALKTMDGTVINGAKLTIRSDGPMREIDPKLQAELAAHFGGTGVVPTDLEDDFDQMDCGEE